MFKFEIMISSTHEIWGYKCTINFHGFDYLQGRKCVVRLEDSCFIYCKKSVKRNTISHIRQAVMRVDRYERSMISLLRKPLKYDIYNKVIVGGPIDVYFVDDDLQNEEYELANMQLESSTCGHKEDCLYLCCFDNLEYVKIGRSIDPESRRYVFDLNCPRPINLLFSIKGMGYLEDIVKHKFKHLNTHGEWYKYDESIINEFDKIKSNGKI